MVQVDVFWSYGLGATFAAMASRQIKSIDAGESFDNNEEKITPFVSKYFISMLLFIACLFAPSGMWLLWQFPHWETMQVASSRADIPVWLVVLFAVTNVTQGILGYWTATKLIQKGNYYGAHLQWFLGYFAMFFILLYGWDGLGWQRFLYDPTVNNGALWQPGMHMGMEFLSSNVALTLCGMGIFIVPPIFYVTGKWIAKGAQLDQSLPAEKRNPNRIKLGALKLIAIFTIAFSSAGLAALIVNLTSLITGHLISYFVGLPVAFILGYFLLFRRGMIVYHFFKLLFLDEPDDI